MTHRRTGFYIHPVSTGDSEQEIDGPDPEDEAKSLASVNGGSEEPCLEDASEEPDQAAISPFGTYLRAPSAYLQKYDGSNKV